MGYGRLTLPAGEGEAGSPVFLSPGRGEVRWGVEAAGHSRTRWMARHSTPTPALPLPGGGSKGLGLLGGGRNG